MKNSTIKTVITLLFCIIFVAMVATSTQQAWAQSPLGKPVQSGGQTVKNAPKAITPEEYFAKNPGRMGKQKPNVFINRVFVTRNNYFAPTQGQLDSLARQRAEGLLQTSEFHHASQALVNRGKGHFDKKGKFVLSQKTTQSDLEAADRRLVYVLRESVRVNRQNVSLNRSLIFNLDQRERTNRGWLWAVGILALLAFGLALWAVLRRYIRRRLATTSGG